MNVLKVFDRAARVSAVAVALFSLNLGATALAQQPPAANFAIAKEIVVANGNSTVFGPLIPGVVEQAKLLFLQQDPALQKDLNDVAANLRTEFAPRVSEVTDELAKLYAANFSEQELKTVLAFYQSPAGKKLVTIQPQVAEQSMRYAQDWARKLSDEVVAKMREEMKKKGHAL